MLEGLSTSVARDDSSADSLLFMSFLDSGTCGFGRWPRSVLSGYLPDFCSTFCRVATPSSWHLPATFVTDSDTLISHPDMGPLMKLWFVLGCFGRFLERNGVADDESLINQAFCLSADLVIDMPVIY
jgi:hypothetical protein